MGYRIIKQWKDESEGERFYAIWSTYTDTFVGLDMKREEVVKFYVDRAVERAEWDTNGILNFLEGKKPDRNGDEPFVFYEDSSMSFRQMLRRHVKMKENCSNPDMTEAVLQKIKELKKT